MKYRYLDVLLWIWAICAVGAAIAHLILPNWTAAGTVWLSSEHWQREIAYFDLFIAALFVWTTRQPSREPRLFASVMLCVLSLALGENHLEGWMREARVFHVLFAVLNFSAAVWAGCAAWRLARTP